jgi:hypothetical protein
VLDGASFDFRQDGSESFEVPVDVADDGKHGGGWRRA